jgi:hypothetical protein
MFNVWLMRESSRGLGRALTEVVLETGQRVVGSARQSEQLSDLRATQKKSPAYCDSIVHNCLPEPMNKFRLPETFLAKLKAASINPAFLLHKSGLPPALCSSRRWYGFA